MRIYFLGDIDAAGLQGDVVKDFRRSFPGDMARSPQQPSCIRSGGWCCLRKSGDGLLASGGSVAVVVIADVPDGQGCGAVSFAGPGMGIEELVGQDAVVAFDLAIWRGV